MCGIFGYIGYRKNAPEIVFGGIKDLEYRGYDSWGVSCVSESKIFINKKAGKIGNAEIHLPKSGTAIAHTRWATHGGVTDANAHPHPDCDSGISIIHNGIFENYLTFKKTLIKKGHKFISQTDSEVIAHMLEESLADNKFSEAFISTFRKVKGMNAVLAIGKDGDQIVAAKNGSPLVVGFGKGENFLASDAAALTPYTNVVYFLEDNQMAILKSDKVEIIDIPTGRKLKPAKQIFESKNTDSGMGSFPNFMLKEIYDQPQTLMDISLSPGYKAGILSRFRKADQIYFMGCGSAFFAALTGKYIFSEIANKEVKPTQASEFENDAKFVNQKTLILPISQSGETMDLIEGVKKAKTKGAGTVCLTNVPGASLYRMSDEKITIGVGREKAVASTKALTGMLAHLILLAYSVEGKFKEGREVVTNSAESATSLLVPDNMGNIEHLAKLLKNKDHIYVIGRGISYPAALETALKIKEISYIHAESFPGGELKHGALALIEKGTPCIVFATGDETHTDTISAAHELSARGAYVIGVGQTNDEVFDYFIKIKDAGVGTVIPNIVFGQVLAYYLTILKGYDPDKPRNLAKSVTVK